MLRALRWPRPLRHRRRAADPSRERKGVASHASTAPVPLSYAVLDGPSPRPPLVFLHGLFGSKSNFQSLAKQLVLQTQRKVLMVDARNHGDSPHSPLMTYEAMSADIQLLLQQLRLHRCVLIGHSMGGKTAMVVTLQRVSSAGSCQQAESWRCNAAAYLAPGAHVVPLLCSSQPELVERLVCVDISPSETTAVTHFRSFIAAMRAVDIPPGLPRSTARRLAEEQLRPVIQDPGVRHFLLTNLVSAEDRFVWRVNLEAVSHHLNELMGFPDFQAPYAGPTLFLGGLKSAYISSDDYPEIERLFPEAEIQYVPEAGHWVHADQPQRFVAAICNFLELPPT